MQRKTKGLVRDAGDLRVLDSAGLLAHHAHISGEGAKRLKGCRYCSRGSTSFTVSASLERVEDPMVESSGADEEAPGSPTPGDEQTTKDGDVQDTERNVRRMVREEMFG